MRLTIAIGLILVLVGGGALYLFKRPEVMAVIGQLSYRPPADDAAMAAAFDDLAADESGLPGVTLGALARARLACIGVSGEEAARQAFLRANLVMLGAGAGSFSVVIPPEARRLPALRPDLAGTGPASGSTADSTAILEMLGDPSAPIHRGLSLSDGFAALELRQMLSELATGGDAFSACTTASPGR